MKISLGTAIALGFSKIKTDANIETAYIMFGNSCQNNCAFCSQSSSSTSNKNHLSRVMWPEFEDEKVISKLIECFKLKTIKRCCFQVLDNKDDNKLYKLIKKLAINGFKISLSKNVKNEEELSQWFDLGIDKVTINIDCVSEKLHKEIKGSHFESKLNFLKKSALKFPNKITTHIIVGLFETEYEIICLLINLYHLKINTALFAFTPIKGTKLEKHLKVSKEKYRKIQIAKYLIDNYGFNIENFIFENDIFKKIDSKNENMLLYLKNGKAFQTSGCKDCNRPYYNERPGGFIYNYPRSLSKKEIQTAIFDSNLFF